MTDTTIHIPQDTLDLWQTLLDIMAAKYIIPAALIMRVNLADIEVFLSSTSEGNPYEVGDSEYLVGSGLYCERVIKTKSPLLVPDALKDTEWNKNPDIKLDMISYLGFPLRLPSNEAFGTICMLDSKENSFAGNPTMALKQFKEYIESYLELKVAIDLRSNPEEIAEKELLCDKLFSKVEKILGTYRHHQ